MISEGNEFLQRGSTRSDPKLFEIMSQNFFVSAYIPSCVGLDLF